MLFALLSPAKRLDFTPPPSFAKPTQPALLKETMALAMRAKKFNRYDLQKLMGISPKLASLNFERFQSFDPKNKKGTKPALFTFAGDVYVGLEASTLSENDMKFAQKHIGMLSGLYGLLRPLDAIQPYRLEMGSPVKTERGRDLIAFWQNSLTAHINAVTDKMRKPVIVNLASNEYWGAVDKTKLKAPVIQCAFKEIKDGKARVLSFFAKKARGLMARAIIDNRWTDACDLKRFNSGGYKFNPKLSTDDEWVFSRNTKPS
tara:strand:+ start:287 stop:1066 length:780 start_codon:yes stop_codon:yes gene_type:complete